MNYFHSAAAIAHKEVKAKTRGRMNDTISVKMITDTDFCFRIKKKKFDAGLFFELVQTVMDINSLRGDLSTITDIGFFFLNPHFLTTQQPTHRRQR